MGWTNDQFAGTLTIPTGATTGQRIVIDGETGTITGYNDDDVVVFTITPGGGFTTYSPADEDDPATTGQLSSAQLRLSVDVPGIPDEDVVPTSLSIGLGTAPFGEEHITTTLQSGYTAGHDGPSVRMGSSSPDFSRDYDIITDNMSVALATDLRLGGAGLAVDEVSQGRGRAEHTAITATTATVTTTETVGIDGAELTFRTGRAYRITAKGYVTSSVANDLVRIRVRKGALGGTAYIDSGSGLQVNVVNGLTPYVLENIVRNVTSPDVTDDLVVTYVRENGTGNVAIAAAASNPAYLTVEDIGAAADFPNANEIV